MKKSKCYLALLTAGIILATVSTIGATKVESPVKSTTLTMEHAQEEFLKKVDIDYGPMSIHWTPKVELFYAP